MSVEVGIIFAFAAMLCWGFGDFLIQKSVRKFGNWETLLFITLLSSIVLTPFLYKDIVQLFTINLEVLFSLILASSVLLVASILDFESLKRGKLAVVEPIWSLEIIVSAFAAFIFIGEIISNMQVIMIATLIFGLFMVSLRSHHFSRKVWLEKGVFIAVLAALAMGMANYLIGIGSRSSNAIITIWFLHAFLMICSLIYLIGKKDTKILFKHMKKNKSFLLSMAVLDTIAWIAFAASMALAPISISVALSESYIVIAVLLGVYVNKEFLGLHQKIGLFLAIASAIILAAITI